MRAGLDRTCETARALVARSLDESLPELPRDVMELHLAGCADCARFAHDVELVTHVLRDAPPERVRLELGGLLRRRAWVLPRTFAFVATATFAIGVASLAGGATPGPATTPARQAAAAPPKLPIGQRMAEPDFTAPVRSPGEA